MKNPRQSIFLFLFLLCLPTSIVAQGSDSLTLTTLVEDAYDLSKKGMSDSAISILLSVIPKYVEIKDTTGYFKARVTLSNVYSTTGEYEKQIEILNEDRLLCEEIGCPPKRLAALYINLGSSFTSTYAYEEGLPVCEKAYQLSLDHGPAYRGAAITNLATCLVKTERLKEAKELLRKELAFDEHTLQTQLQLTSGLAGAYRQEDNRDSLIYYGLAAVKIAKQLSPTSYARESSNLALHYSKYGEWSESEHYAKIAIDTFRKYKIYNRSFSIATRQYINARLSLGEHVEAYHFQDYHDLMMKSYDNKRLAYINEVNEKYKNDSLLAFQSLLEFDNELQKEKINSFKVVLGFTGLVLVIVALAAFLLKRKNEDLFEAKSQISRLNQDLNHRTSNYLDSIIILLERQRDSAAAAGLDTSVVNSLERQVLAFTKVQDKLGTDLDTVNLKEYLEDFCATVREALAAQGRPVQFDTNIDDVDVKPAFAAPLALIINELATNSMKYARREEGILRIALDAIEENSGELRIFYRDGGRQEGEIDQSVFSSGQGVELILGFTDELQGKVIRYGKDSYDYEVVFGLVG